MARRIKIEYVLLTLLAFAVFGAGYLASRDPGMVRLITSITHSSQAPSAVRAN